MHLFLYFSNYFVILLSCSRFISSHFLCCWESRLVLVNEDPSLHPRCGDTWPLRNIDVVILCTLHLCGRRFFGSFIKSFLWGIEKESINSVILEFPFQDEKQQATTCTFNICPVLTCLHRCSKLFLQRRSMDCFVETYVFL